MYMYTARDSSVHKEYIHSYKVYINYDPWLCIGALHHFTIYTCMQSNCIYFVSKLYVSFAKEPYKRNYILQKRPIILRSLLIAANQYVYIHSYPWLCVGALHPWLCIGALHHFTYIHACNRIVSSSRLLKMICLLCERAL